MNQVITRDFINKNIIFFDIKKESKYHFDDISREIDLFKNILLSASNNNTIGKSIVIGMQPSIEQTACIFACFELGIKICIIDYGRRDTFKQYSYIDPKTELLLPIDFFIVTDKRGTDKFDYFSRICKQTIITDSIKEKNYSKNDFIYASPETDIMTCTSSGTTGTPKVIKHNHKFIFNLSKRNSHFYDNSVGITHNLNHGSSFATFFLPSLCSDKVTNVYNALQDFHNEENLNFLQPVDHIMMPYSHQVSQFIESNCSKNKIIYTLSSISADHKQSYENKKFKDLISFFGSNETSGPTLINRTSTKNFSSTTYFKIDYFYKIDILKGELTVKLPFYNNVVINTKDKFSIIDQKTFRFHGRNDLKRINGRTVPEEQYIKIIKKEKIKSFLIVLDFQENKIYLAILSNYDNLDLKIFNIKKHIETISNKTHTIDKFAKVDISEFMSGIKPDHELLRTYFRKYIS